MRPAALAVALAGIAAVGTLTGGAYYVGARVGAPRLPAGAGRFQVVYHPPRDAALRPWHDRVRRDSILERVAARLDASLAIPEHVRLAFEECGEEEAYYDPEPRKVVYCYETVRADHELLAAEAGIGAGEAERRTRDVTTFFLYHEVGHALVDVLLLPITGKEEDAVDQFAIYFLVESGRDEDARAVLSAARTLHALARRARHGAEELPLWDVHSLDEQREANLLCWLYGHDTRRYERLVREGRLNGERAESCEDEHALLADSWEALLDASWKASARAARR